MKPVETKFVAYIYQYKACCDYSNCETGKVNKSKEFLIFEIPYSELKVFKDHVNLLHFFYSRSLPTDYSYLNASTGFLVAARYVCRLTVNIAIPRAIIPAKTKIHQVRSVL